MNALPGEFRQTPTTDRFNPARMIESRGVAKIYDFYSSVSPARSRAIHSTAPVMSSAMTRYAVTARVVP